MPRRYLFYNIDVNFNSNDSWEYHNVLSRFNKINKIEKGRLIDILCSLKTRKSKCYIFGTGNSLSLASNLDFSEGIVIVSNTIVKDRLLIEHLKPDIIVAGDALYHFSDSLFSKAFRRDLFQRLLENNQMIFIYPAIFDVFIKSELGVFKDRLFGLPLGKMKSITYDIIKQYELPSIGNVLNLLLLPLACTLSKEIFLWGFDGRAPSDDDFWKNSDKHFYSEFIDDQKKNHPAFYKHFLPKDNLKSYVEQVHGNELELILNEAEKQEYRFHMMHFSHTQALQKRLLC
jgi:hypothetical protein